MRLLIFFLGAVLVAGPAFWRLLNYPDVLDAAQCIGCIIIGYPYLQSLYRYAMEVLT